MIAVKKSFDSPKYRPDNRMLAIGRAGLTYTGLAPKPAGRVWGPFRTVRISTDAFIEAHRRWRYETGEEEAIRA
jgi:hypothetical protein